MAWIRMESTSPSWQPAKQWRKALNVIRTCHRLARLAVRSTGVLPRSTSYVAIKIHHDGDSEEDAGSYGNNDAGLFSVTAHDELFKGLVKDRRQDCFRRLGGPAGVAAALASDAERGIRGDDGDVRRRREAFGGNTYPKRKLRTFLGHVWDALSDVFLVVLLLCAAVSLGFGVKEHGLKGGWYDGTSIFLAVCLVATISAISNHSQAKRFENLASESDDNIAVTVVRAARRQEVSKVDVVVGDVVILKIGDSVPADGVFLEGHGLQVDESSMSGEPHPIEIDTEKSPFLRAGVKIVHGCGRMLVTAVGTDTLWGEMMRCSIIKETTEPTPLKEHLKGLTWRIGKISVAVALLVFTVLAARHFTGSTKEDQFTFDAVFSALVGIFQQAVTIIVVAIPEGLSLVVTLTLACSIKRAVKENPPVRCLSACETITGSVTAICTDSTGGTLTLNQMKVTEFWVGTQQPRAATEIAGSVVSLLCQGAGINSTGSVSPSPTEISAGSPTEKALQSWAVTDLGMDSDALTRSFDVVHVEAFNSDKKRRSGVMIRDNATGALMLHSKGAAEIVLSNCSMYVETEGPARDLGVEPRKKLEKIINDMAMRGLRCIAFAYKQVDSDQSKIDDEGQTLLGFVGLKDPCGPEVDTVLTATRWERCVYNNIQKFIQFQLTVNVAALVINFVSAITTGMMSVTTVELLWVNLIMETMDVLATETPTQARMDSPPVGRTAPPISNAMWRNLAAQAFFQIAVLLNVPSHHGRGARPAGGDADQVRLHQDPRIEALRCVPCHCRRALAEQGIQDHPLDGLLDCPLDLDTVMVADF